jgi:hypothetical protein
MDVEAELSFVKDIVTAGYSPCVIWPSFLGRGCRLCNTLMNVWKIPEAGEITDRRLDGHGKVSESQTVRDIDVHWGSTPTTLAAHLDTSIESEYIMN